MFDKVGSGSVAADIGRPVEGRAGRLAVVGKFGRAGRLAVVGKFGRAGRLAVVGSAYCHRDLKIIKICIMNFDVEFLSTISNFYLIL